MGGEEGQVGLGGASEQPWSSRYFYISGDAWHSKYTTWTSFKLKASHSGYNTHLT